MHYRRVRALHDHGGKRRESDWARCGNEIPRYVEHFHLVLAHRRRAAPVSRFESPHSGDVSLRLEKWACAIKRALWQLARCAPMHSTFFVSYLRTLRYISMSANNANGSNIHYKYTLSGPQLPSRTRAITFAPAVVRAAWLACFWEWSRGSFLFAGGFDRAAALWNAERYPFSDNVTTRFVC